LFMESSDILQTNHKRKSFR